MFVSQIIIIFADAYQKVLQTKVEGYMTKREISKLFEDRKIRAVWDDKEEKWYFSIVDVVGMLTDQPDIENARNYWKVLKYRLKKEGNETVTKCNALKLRAADGKSYKTDVVDTEQCKTLIWATSKQWWTTSVLVTLTIGLTNAQTLEDNMKCDADGGDDNILK